MNVTVTFTCTAGTLPIGTCPSPQTLSTDGAGQVVSGTVTDTAGDTATASVTINLDKTMPTLTVTSPADQTVETASPVTVSGTLTDALSGVSGVFCDGVTATLSGGSFSCNISLTVGVNLVVVRGTDIAGNVAGDNFHLSLTGTLPAPASLAVTPTGVNMVVGGTQQFTVVDDQGRPRPDATWSVDNTSIATIDTSSSPTLTAVAVGQANLTATVGSLTAQTQVNVLSGAGTSLPPGTVLWSAPTPSGNNVEQTLQAEPVLGSPGLYSVQLTSGRQVSVSGLTSDGQQLWSSASLSGSFTGIPDGNGGILMLLFPGYPGKSSIIDLDGQTGSPVWQYSSNGTISLADLPSGYSAYSHIAVGPDGSVYFEESVGNVLSLVALDGTTGAVKARYSVPFGTDTINSDGTCGHTGPPETFVDHGVQLTDPVVGPDGTVMAGQSVLSTVTTDGCTNQVSDDQQLSLLEMAPDGTTSTTLVYNDTSHHTQNPGSLIDEVIPDPFGGALVSWEYDYPPAGSQQSFHITDVGSSGLSDFTVPFAASGMVLGENNTLFMAGGNQAFAYQLPGGLQLWVYTSSGGQLSSLVATNDGGILFNDTQLGVIPVGSSGSPGEAIARLSGASPFRMAIPVPGSLNGTILGSWVGLSGGELSMTADLFVNPDYSIWPVPGGDALGQDEAVPAAALTVHFGAPGGTPLSAGDGLDFSGTQSCEPTLGPWDCVAQTGAFVWNLEVEGFVSDDASKWTIQQGVQGLTKGNWIDPNDPNQVAHPFSTNINKPSPDDAPICVPNPPGSPICFFQQTPGQNKIFWLDSPGTNILVAPDEPIDSMTSVKNFASTICSNVNPSDCVTVNWYVRLIVNNGILDTTQSSAGFGTLSLNF